jgi:hypothetical protein
MGKQLEIIAPSRSAPTVVRASDLARVVSPPPSNPGGLVSGTLARWEANRHARTITAYAGRTRAESDLFDAQTQAIESYVKRQRAVCRLQELPDILATDRAIRHTERREELRAIEHRRECAELQRMTDVARAEAVLVDAQQALRAQQDFGYTTYELAWKKKNCELLDVELSAAERRAMLREHIAGLDQYGASPLEHRDGDEIDDVLYEARDQLRASGLDTTKLDAEISRRAMKSR